jgi:uncharacterized repeat protein (TIGR01451 family)
MRIRIEARLAPLFLVLCVAGALAAPAAAMAAPVNLGGASTFTVLGASTVTNTGPTVITGDLGLYPGTSVVGFPPGVVVGGTIHATDAVANDAHDGATSAYNQIAALASTADLTGQDLGGLILTPGIYNFDSSAQMTGALTLDAQGDPDAVFIFKIGSTLTLASSASVNLVGGARFSRVYWQVGSSATLGTSSHFEGVILAQTSITLITGVTYRGQFLALNGAVTLDTNTGTNADSSIQVAKSANPLALDSGAGPVTYTYTVTTTGTVDLIAVSVTDDKLATVTYVSGDTNADGALQPTETWVFSAAAVLSVTTTNTATATGTGNGETVTDTAIANVVVTPLAVPVIHIAKSAAPTALVSGPGSVTYTYTVTNPGTVDLSAVSVTDDKLSPVTYVSGDTNSDDLLQSGETWIYTGSMVLQATMSNTATATGTGAGQTVNDSASATVIVTPLATPEIHIAKSAAPTSLPLGPGSVTYTYTVTNPGTVDMSAVSVTDNRLSPVTYVSGDTNSDDLLQPGETWIFTGSMELQATTTNTGTAHGTGNGQTVTDAAAATVIVTPLATPVIHIAKSASPSALVSGPGSVTYTYTVTNPGTVDLSAVSVTDDRLSPVTYVSGDTNSDDLLQSGETWIFTGSMELQATTTNTGTAHGTGKGQSVTDTADVTVAVTTPDVPVIHIHKSAEASAPSSGTVAVTYTYTVTNPGTVALSNVAVTDDKLSPVTYVSGDDNDDGLLQPSETWVYTGSAVLTGTTTNVATASATGTGERVADTAAVTVTLAGDAEEETGTPTPAHRATVTGGRLPRTATPWYDLLLGGVALILVGVFGFWWSGRNARE